MFGLQKISIEYLASVPVLIGLVMVVMLGLAVFLYLRTNPPISPLLRSLLVGLRVIAVVALFLALFETVLAYSRAYEREPRVSVVIDRSESMDKEEQGRTRVSRVDSLRSSADFSRLESAADVTTYFFAGDIAQDATDLKQDETALGEALYELNSSELGNPADYWLLLSDGRSNSGREPQDVSRSIQSPVLAVDLAVNTGKLDVGLSDLEYNPIMFVGQRADIKVKLTWQNAVGKSIRVELLDSGRVVDTKPFTIDLEGGIGEVELEYLPEKPGQRILEINIPALEGEESLGNNRRSFAVKILKSRLNILIATATPDYDVGFIKRFLDNSEKFDVDLCVTGNNSGNLQKRFPTDQAEVNRYDLVLLHDPNPRQLRQHETILRSYLSDRGGSIWVIMGERYAQAGPSDWFNQLLPFYQSRQRPIRYHEFQGEPSEGQLYHPAIRLAESQSDIRTTWSELPPFESVVQCDSTDPNGVILATAAGARIGGRWPILGYKVMGPGKVFATAAQPIWKWGFTNLGFGEDTESFTRFMEGVSSWLTVKEDFDPISIKPEKDVFSRGEVVRFEGYAYDQGFRPIPGVVGQVRLQGENGQDALEADLIEIGAGKFRAELFNMPAGTYRYSGYFEKEGRRLKEVEGVIRIETFTLEEFDRTGDPATLTAIARLSGGDYFKFDQFGDAVNSMNLAPVAEISQSEIVVWNKPWLLLLIIAALSIEWISRKLMQLI